jgi:hypothetical protein
MEIEWGQELRVYITTEFSESADFFRLCEEQGIQEFGIEVKNRSAGCVARKDTN